MNFIKEFTEEARAGRSYGFLVGEAHRATSEELRTITGKMLYAVKTKKVNKQISDEIWHESIGLSEFAVEIAAGRGYGYIKDKPLIKSYLEEAAALVAYVIFNETHETEALAALLELEEIAKD